MDNGNGPSNHCPQAATTNNRVASPTLEATCSLLLVAGWGSPLMRWRLNSGMCGADAMIAPRSHSAAACPLAPLGMRRPITRRWLRWSSGNWIENTWSLRSEEHTREHQSLMRTPYAAFCLNVKYNATGVDSKGTGMNPGTSRA